MRFRKLRIAWSILCGVACALLIILWVRSCTWLDYGKVGEHRFASAHGQFLWERVVVPIYVYEGPTASPYPKVHWGINSFPHAVCGYWEENGGISISYWLPVVILFVVGPSGWISARFTIRTLLITTMIVSVVLGFSMYAGRK
jgi:hypothetical protein